MPSNSHDAYLGRLRHAYNIGGQFSTYRKAFGHAVMERAEIIFNTLNKTL